MSVMTALPQEEVRTNKSGHRGIRLEFCDHRARQCPCSRAIERLSLHGHQGLYFRQAIASAQVLVREFSFVPINRLLQSLFKMDAGPESEQAFGLADVERTARLAIGLACIPDNSSVKTGKVCDQSG